MASRDDRTPISSLHGLSSTSQKPYSVIPDHTRRWKLGPQRIVSPAVGNMAVNNPYSKIGSLSSNHTNPTASRTLLTMRKPAREAGPKFPAIKQSISKKKGKAKATESPAPQESASCEVIDVDADQLSTDELDIISERSPQILGYSDSRRTLSSRTNRNDETIAGPSLIGDGEHTRRLQARHETKPKPRLERRSVSPIESFSEFESIPKSNVMEKRAKFEALSKANEPNLPIIDFKVVNKKNQMRPKGGTVKAQQKTLSSCFSEAGRLGRLTLHDSERLPLSMVYIGLRQCPEFKYLTFDDGDTTIRLSGNSDHSSSMDVPISRDTFSSMQFTDSKNLTYPPILYLSTLKSEWFRSWQSRFGSDFSAGDDDRGQVAIQFDSEDPAWRLEVYKSRMSKLAPRVSSSVIRSIDSKKLWDSLQRNNKNDLGDVDDSSISLASPGEVNHRKNQETQDSNTIQADPSSKVEALNKLRYTPHDGTLPNRLEPQARVSILNKGNHEESIEGSLPAKPLARVNIQRAEGNEEESIEVSPVEPPPKRRRVELRRSTRQQEKAQNIDPDELILVFPYGVPGAVNVTRSDLARLDPEALLNDTLIEFGLKLWLKNLEFENPALASQVYLFNSFFYKKLNKRNIEEGFQSVRKWTSKTDIFSKKYIIIPINENLHWYCAIIYEPEHILQQLPDAGTPHTNAVTRRQARDMQVSEEVVSEKVEVTPDPADADEDMQDGTASENEVERMALSNANPLNEDPVTSVAPDFGVSSREASDQIVSNLTPGSPMEVDTELPLVVEVEKTSSSKSTMSGTTTNEGTNTPVGPPNDVRATAVQLNEITPARFYGKSFTNGARKRVSIAAENIKDDLPKTKIFILDSIGNRHPQAMKQLNKWLQLEAEDKKKITKPASAFTKLVSLPVQPNFSDCGIYVIHFVQTLMEDPEHYCKVIMMKDRPPSSERQVDWKHATVSTIRDQLRGHILQLSDEWYELRAAREEEKKQQQIVEESDEDSDVAIVDHVRASAKKGRSNKSARTKS